METEFAFGQSLKQRRRELDLTQEALARRVGCAADTIRKIEAGRLRPSRQIAELLAQHLELPSEEQPAFVARARQRPPTPLSHTAAGAAPYVGLCTFQADDAERFFGRAALIATLLERAACERLLVVLGPSGSGKSSVVLAGLLPALQRGALPGSATWRYLALRPGPRPLDTLALALAQATNAAQDAPTLATRLADDPAALAQTIRQIAPAPTQRVVLLVDQCEELWSQAQADQRQQFIGLLLAALAADCPLLLVLTMRADFLHHAATHSELARQIGEHDLIVGPMQPDELRVAIERPAQLAGGTFEPGLVDELVAQTAAQPGALPLLAYTLFELWESRRADGTLTWAAYRALGGVAGALSARADSILAQHYGPEERRDLRRQLVQLVQLGEGNAVARRRVPLAELVPDGSSELDLQALLGPLVDQRLLTVGHDAHGRATVEIAHEALVHAWPTLQRWIDEERDDLRLQLQIAAAGREWQANHERADLLWHGLRLAQAERLQSHLPLNARDVRFLAASRAQVTARAEAETAARQERERLLFEQQARQRDTTRLRRFLAALGVLLLIALLLAGLAFGQRQAAQQARAEAEATARQARALAAAGEASFELARRPEQAVLLALAADRATTQPPPDMVTRALYQTFEQAAIRYRLADQAGPVRATAWRPDGQTLASAGDDGVVYLWDAHGQPITTLRNHTGALRALAWSPDGQLLASAGADQAVLVWDVARGTPRATLRGHSSWVSALAWHPAGQTLASASYDGTIRIWDLGSQTERMQIAQAGALRTLAWHPAGQLLAAAGDQGSAVIWETATGRQLRTLDEHPGGVWSVSWSPDGQTLLTTSTDGVARLWDADGHLVRRLPCSSGWLWAAAWHPDGRRVLIGTFDGGIQIWDAQTGQQLQTLRGHSGRIWTVAWRPGSQQIASGSDDGSLRMWDSATAPATRKLPDDALPAGSTSWSPDLRRVARWNEDGAIVLWDSTRVALHLPAQPGGVRWVHWSADGARLLVINGAGTLTVWDTANGRLLHELAVPGSPAWVAERPDGQLALVGSADGTTRLIDLASGSTTGRLTGSGVGGRAQAWRADGLQIATGGDDGTISIWDAASGAQLQVLRGHHGAVWSLAWSRDGRRLLSGGSDGTARIWEVASGSASQVFDQHTGGLWAVAWSDDERQIAAAGDDSTARVWDVASGATVRLLDGHSGGLIGLRWDHNGSGLTVGNDSGVLRGWLLDHDMAAAVLTRQACGLFSDAEIGASVPDWRGCTDELAAQAPQLARYDALWGAQ